MEQIKNSLNAHDVLAYSAPTNNIDPLGDGISFVELVRVSGSDLDVVNAARVSYGKTSTEVTDRDKKLISFLMEHNHTSPFEHNQFRSEEHTSELQSLRHLVCRLLLEKKK